MIFGWLDDAVLLYEGSTFVISHLPRVKAHFDTLFALVICRWPDEKNFREFYPHLVVASFNLIITILKDFPL